MVLEDLARGWEVAGRRLAVVVADASFPAVEEHSQREAGGAADKLPPPDAVSSRRAAVAVPAGVHSARIVQWRRAVSVARRRRVAGGGYRPLVQARAGAFPTAVPSACDHVQARSGELDAVAGVVADLSRASAGMPAQPSGELGPRLVVDHQRVPCGRDDLHRELRLLGEVLLRRVATGRLRAEA